MFEEKRVYLLAGHYGSGKTNVAVNLALALRAERERVAIADLDIVNPYFRTSDSAEELQEAGVRLISSAYAGSNVDIPAMPQDLYSITDEADLTAVVDVGGDDRGALALGRIAPALRKEGNYAMWAVLNCYRPLTPDVPSALEVLREIEQAGGLPFTGLINNSNLGAATAPETVLRSRAFAEGVAAACNLPLVMTAVRKDLLPALNGKIPALFGLDLQKPPVE